MPFLLLALVSPSADVVIKSLRSTSLMDFLQSRILDKQVLAVPQLTEEEETVW